jgi:hypothetical protein
VQTASQRQWYQNNRESILARLRVRRAANPEKHRLAIRKSNTKSRACAKAAVFLHYGQFCRCCGTDTKEFLTMDHINGGGSKHQKQIQEYIYIWLVKHNFPNDFQVLCFNCNMSKGIYGECPHKREKDI